MEQREHARNVLLEENKEECKVKAEAAVAASTAESIKAYAKVHKPIYVCSVCFHLITCGRHTFSACLID